MPHMDQHVFTVGQVNECVKYLIEDSPLLDSLYVVGEISNFKPGNIGGHLYFSLKDESGVLHSVMFRSSASRLKFRPENGMRVIAHGRISVYTRDGQYQLYIDQMQPDGLGSLAAAFEQLKGKLSAEGLFDDARKRPIPTYVNTVGVITSPSGAAVRDIINILTRRAPQVKMILFPALVQGDGAPKQLCSGIRYFNTHAPVDVIIIGRGGGSLEELWAFNDETLARTVAASDIPVISAVGHETDFTICDFCADLRAPTPSAAAELAVPNRDTLLRQLQATQASMKMAMQRKLMALHQSMDTLSKKRVLTSPEEVFEIRYRALDALTEKLVRRAERHITNAREALTENTHALQTNVNLRITSAKHTLASASARLSALSPLSVLLRGYSAVFDETGKSIKTVKTLKNGDSVTLRLSDGTARAAITDIKADKLRSAKNEKENSHG